MERLASLATRRPWRVIALTVVFLAISVVVGGSLTSSLTSGGFEDKGAEFYKARQRLEAATGATPQPGLIALVEPGSAVTSGQGRAAVERTAATVRRDPAVAQVVTAFDGGGRALISNDGKSSYLVAFFKPVGDDAAGTRPPAIEDSLAGDPQVRLGGAAVVGEHVGTIIGEDLARAELIAFPIIFLLSLWVFRGVIAALLPPLMGGVVIFGGFLGLGLFNEGDGPLGLRPQPRHRPEPGPRDRLQPADRLPLPGGDGRDRARPRRAAANPCAPRARAWRSARSRWRRRSRR